MKEATWTCGDGKRMRVSQMSDSHLGNSIAMILRGHDARGRRVGPKTRAKLKALLVEAEIRRQGLRR